MLDFRHVTFAMIYRQNPSRRNVDSGIVVPSVAEAFRLLLPANCIILVFGVKP